MPVGHVDRGKQANAVKLDPPADRREPFAGDVVEPVRSAAMKAGGLGDNARAPELVPALEDQVRDGTDAVVAWLQWDVGLAAARIFHLAEAVVVEAEDIDELEAPAIFRMLEARYDVPCEIGIVI